MEEYECASELLEPELDSFLGDDLLLPPSPQELPPSPQELPHMVRTDTAGGPPSVELKESRPRGRKRKEPERKEAKESKETSKESSKEAKEPSQRSAKTPKKSTKKSTKKVRVEDPATETLRSELKLCILKHAEATQMSEVELKKELTRAARVKEQDLQFELDKQRLRVSGSWTKELAKGVKNGAGLVLDRVLKGNGHIFKEFEDDKSLETAIHGEMEKLTFLMDPRLRIGILSAKDVVTGYGRKMSDAALHMIPPPPPLVRQNATVPHVSI